jgi:hypothetical protein
MNDFLSLADAARALQTPPDDLSKLLYRLGQEGDRLAPMIGRRRLIPRANLPELRRLLADRAAKKRQATAAK